MPAGAAGKIDLETMLEISASKVNKTAEEFRNIALQKLEYSQACTQITYVGFQQLKLK